MRLQSSRRAFRRVPTALRTALFVLAAGFSVVGEPASAGVNYIYVGASAAACTATSLAQALGMAWATAGADEIRLTRTLTYTNANLYVHDWDLDDTGMLIVSGGWDDCLDPSSSGETVLSGSPEQVVVEVAESGASSTGIFVVLRDLELTGDAVNAVDVRVRASPGLINSLEAGKVLATIDLAGPTDCSVGDESDRDAIVRRLGPDPLRRDTDPQLAFDRPPNHR